MELMRRANLPEIYATGADFDDWNASCSQLLAGLPPAVPPA